MGIATIAFMIIAYLLDNFLFGIFIIIASFTVAMYGSKKPQVVEFQLTAQGIKIANRLYPYRNIKSFWLHYNPPFKKEVSFLFNKTINPRLVIPLNDIDPNNVRDILVQFVKEAPQDDSFSDIISRALGF